jgi:hypothetical protein
MFYRSWLRWTAIITLIAFLGTEAAWGQGPSQSLQISGKLPDPISANPVAVTELPSLDVDHVTVQAQFGTIRKRHAGPKKQIVIHIEDAHVHQQAQRHIAALLDYFVKNYAVRVACLEGASGRLATDALSFLPDRDVRQVVADYFLKEGRLTGAEHYAVTQRPPLTLYGAENEQLYRKHYEAYRDTYALRQENAAVFEGVGKVLGKLARFVLSPELNRFYQVRRAFSSREIEMGEYLKAVFEFAKQTGLLRGRFRSLQLYETILNLGGRVDFEHAAEEIFLFLQELKAASDPLQMRELTDKITQLRTSSEARPEVYDYLVRQMRARHWESRYRRLRIYLEYVSACDRFAMGALDSLAELEHEIEVKLSKTREERLYLYWSRIFDIYQKVAGLELTQKDARFFYRHRKVFNMVRLRHFLEPLMDRHHFTFELPQDMGKVDRCLPMLDRFYALAVQRDEALTAETLRKMKDENSPAVVLVTGGFHTPGISKALERAGYSYITIMPKLSEIEEKKTAQLYEDALLKRPLSVEKLFSSIASEQTEKETSSLRFQLQPPLMTPNASNAQTLFHHPEQVLAVSFLRMAFLMMAFKYRSPYRAGRVLKSVPDPWRVIPYGLRTLSSLGYREPDTKRRHKKGTPGPVQVVYRVHRRPGNTDSRHDSEPGYDVFERSENRAPQIVNRFGGRRSRKLLILPMGGHYLHIAADIPQYKIPQDVLREMRLRSENRSKPRRTHRKPRPLAVERLPDRSMLSAAALTAGNADHVFGDSAENWKLADMSEPEPYLLTKGTSTAGAVAGTEAGDKWRKTVDTMISLAVPLASPQDLQKPSAVLTAKPLQDTEEISPATSAGKKEVSVVHLKGNVTGVVHSGVNGSIERTTSYKVGDGSPRTVKETDVWQLHPADKTLVRQMTRQLDGEANPFYTENLTYSYDQVNSSLRFSGFAGTIRLGDAVYALKGDYHYDDRGQLRELDIQTRINQDGINFKPQNEEKTLYRWLAADQVEESVYRPRQIDGRLFSAAELIDQKKLPDEIRISKIPDSNAPVIMVPIHRTVNRFDEKGNLAAQVIVVDEYHVEVKREAASSSKSALAVPIPSKVSSSGGGGGIVSSRGGGGGSKKQQPQPDKNQNTTKDDFGRDSDDFSPRETDDSVGWGPLKDVLKKNKKRPTVELPKTPENIAKHQKEEENEGRGQNDDARNLLDEALAQMPQNISEETEASQENGEDQINPPEAAAPEMVEMPASLNAEPQILPNPESLPAENKRIQSPDQEQMDVPIQQASIAVTVAVLTGGSKGNLIQTESKARLSGKMKVEAQESLLFYLTLGGILSGAALMLTITGMLLPAGLFDGIRDFVVTSRSFVSSTSSLLWLVYEGTVLGGLFIFSGTFFKSRFSRTFLWRFFSKSSMLTDLENRDAAPDLRSEMRNTKWHIAGAMMLGLTGLLPSVTRNPSLGSENHQTDLPSADQWTEISSDTVPVTPYHDPEDRKIGIPVVPGLQGEWHIKLKPGQLDVKAGDLIGGSVNGKLLEELQALGIRTDQAAVEYGKSTGDTTLMTPKQKAQFDPAAGRKIQEVDPTYGPKNWHVWMNLLTDQVVAQHEATKGATYAPVSGVIQAETLQNGLSVDPNLKRDPVLRIIPAEIFQVTLRVPADHYGPVLEVLVNGKPAYVTAMTVTEPTATSPAFMVDAVVFAPGLTRQPKEVTYRFLKSSAALSTEMQGADSFRGTAAHGRVRPRPHIQMARPELEGLLLMTKQEWTRIRAGDSYATVYGAARFQEIVDAESRQIAEAKRTIAMFNTYVPYQTPPPSPGSFFKSWHEIYGSPQADKTIYKLLAAVNKLETFGALSRYASASAGQSGIFTGSIRHRWQPGGKGIAIAETVPYFTVIDRVLVPKETPVEANDAVRVILRSRGAVLDGYVQFVNPAVNDADGQDRSRYKELVVMVPNDFNLWLAGGAPAEIWVPGTQEPLSETQRLTLNDSIPQLDSQRVSEGFFVSSGLPLLVEAAILNASGRPQTDAIPMEIMRLIGQDANSHDRLAALQHLINHYRLFFEDHLADIIRQGHPECIETVLRTVREKDEGVVILVRLFREFADGSSTDREMLGRLLSLIEELLELSPAYGADSSGALTRLVHESRKDPLFREVSRQILGNLLVGRGPNSPAFLKVLVSGVETNLTEPVAGFWTDNELAEDMADPALSEELRNILKAELGRRLSLSRANNSDLGFGGKEAVTGVSDWIIVDLWIDAQHVRLNLQRDVQTLLRSPLWPIWADLIDKEIARHSLNDVGAKTVPKKTTVPQGGLRTQSLQKTNRSSPVADPVFLLADQIQKDRLLRDWLQKGRFHDLVGLLDDPGVRQIYGRRILDDLLKGAGEKQKSVARMILYEFYLNADSQAADFLENPDTGLIQALASDSRFLPKTDFPESAARWICQQALVKYFSRGQYATTNPPIPLEWAPKLFAALSVNIFDAATFPLHLDHDPRHTLLREYLNPHGRKQFDEAMARELVRQSWIRAIQIFRTEYPLTPKIRAIPGPIESLLAQIQQACDPIQFDPAAVDVFLGNAAAQQVIRPEDLDRLKNIQLEHLEHTEKNEREQIRVPELAWRFAKWGLFILGVIVFIPLVLLIYRRLMAPLLAYRRARFGHFDDDDSFGEEPLATSETQRRRIVPSGSDDVAATPGRPEMRVEAEAESGRFDILLNTWERYLKQRHLSVQDASLMMAVARETLVHPQVHFDPDEKLVQVHEGWDYRQERKRYARISSLILISIRRLFGVLSRYWTKEALKKETLSGNDLMSCEILSHILMLIQWGDFAEGHRSFRHLIEALQTNVEGYQKTRVRFRRPQWQNLPSRILNNYIAVGLYAIPQFFLAYRGWPFGMRRNGRRWALNELKRICDNAGSIMGGWYPVSVVARSRELFRTVFVKEVNPEEVSSSAEQPKEWRQMLLRFLLVIAIVQILALLSTSLVSGVIVNWWGRFFSISFILTLITWLTHLIFLVFGFFVPHYYENRAALKGYKTRAGELVRQIEKRHGSFPSAREVERMKTQLAYRSEMDPAKPRALDILVVVYSADERQTEREEFLRKILEPWLRMGERYRQTGAVHLLLVPSGKVKKTGAALLAGRQYLESRYEELRQQEPTLPENIRRSRRMFFYVGGGEESDPLSLVQGHDDRPLPEARTLLRNIQKGIQAMQGLRKQGVGGWYFSPGDNDFNGPVDSRGAVTLFGAFASRAQIRSMGMGEIFYHPGTGVVDTLLEKPTNEQHVRYLASTASELQQNSYYSSNGSGIVPKYDDLNQYLANAGSLLVVTDGSPAQRALEEMLDLMSEGGLSLKTGNGNPPAEFKGIQYYAQGEDRPGFELDLSFGILAPVINGMRNLSHFFQKLYRAGLIPESTYNWWDYYLVKFFNHDRIQKSTEQIQAHVEYAPPYQSSLEDWRSLRIWRDKWIEDRQGHHSQDQTQTEIAVRPGLIIDARGNVLAGVSPAEWNVPGERDWFVARVPLKDGRQVWLRAPIDDNPLRNYQLMGVEEPAPALLPSEPADRPYVSFSWLAQHQAEVDYAKLGAMAQEPRREVRTSARLEWRSLSEGNVPELLLQLFQVALTLIPVSAIAAWFFRLLWHWIRGDVKFNHWVVMRKSNYGGIVDVSPEGQGIWTRAGSPEDRDYAGQYARTKDLPLHAKPEHFVVKEATKWLGAWEAFFQQRSEIRRNQSVQRLPKQDTVEMAGEAASKVLIEDQSPKAVPARTEMRHVQTAALRESVLKGLAEAEAVGGQNRLEQRESEFAVRDLAGFDQRLRDTLAAFVEQQSAAGSIETLGHSGGLAVTFDPACDKLETFKEIAQNLPRGVKMMMILTGVRADAERAQWHTLLKSEMSGWPQVIISEAEPGKTFLDTLIGKNTSETGIKAKNVLRMYFAEPLKKALPDKITQHLYQSLLGLTENLWVLVSSGEEQDTQTAGLDMAALLHVHQMLERAA